MRVITFSQYFPTNHPRKGEPTYFVEKIWKSFIKPDYSLPKEFHDYCKSYALMTALSPMDHTVKYFEVKAKYHTIREGRHWKAGDLFSPRIWTGLPYRSKQMQFAPPIQIKKILKFVRDKDGSMWIDDYLYQQPYDAIATNDGLSNQDFIDWIIKPRKKVFKGQIICWNENINY